MAIVDMLVTVGLLILCCWFSYTDISKRIISNKLMYPAILSLLIFRTLFSPEYLWGLIPSVLLFLIFMISPPSLGAGDVKLVALLGLGIGLERAVVSLLLMCVFVFLYLAGRRLLFLKDQSSVPVAPFLTFGLLVIVFVL